MKKIPWLKLRKKTDPDFPVRAPLALGPLSNGEFFHPDTPDKKLIRKLIMEKAETESRRHGVDRRDFLASAMGMCTSLYMINLVNGCGGGESGPNINAGNGKGGASGSGGGGPFNVPADAMSNEDLAECVIGQVNSEDGSDDFIVDMQSHFINPGSAYLTNPIIGAGFNAFLADIKNRVEWVTFLPGCAEFQCYASDAFMEHYFLDSDTTVGVLSGIAYVQCAGSATASCDFAPLTNLEINEAKLRINEQIPGRVLGHAMVMPNDRIDAQLAAMEENAAWGVDAWKTYPPWSADRASGYWLDDPETGIRMIEKGREVGVKVFCVHKGFPLSGFSRTYTDPREMGIVAKMYPDVTFVTYHSAFEHGLTTSGQGTLDTEGPFDPDGKWDPQNPTKYPVDKGVNSLVSSLLANGIVPNDPSVRLYSELGGTWPSLITRPVEAAHVLGKLLQYIGEDRIVWGTDCLWFGSPRPVIEAFRAFEIPVEMQEQYGYPALTKQAKAKILGVNAARIHNLNPCATYPALAQLRRDLEGEFGARRYMMMPTPGPRTRREFLALREEEHREKLRFSGHSFMRKGTI